MWMSKIIFLQVNTEYDQKEQTFRNFAGGIGPLSSPSLAYEFDSSLLTPVNVTVLWTDPHGHLADVNYLQLDDGSLIGHIRPHLNEKLAIGSWNVLLVVNNEIVVKLKFLVVPQLYWKKERISPLKAKELNSGSSGPYSHVKDDNKMWRQLLDSSDIRLTANTDHFNKDGVLLSLEHNLNSLISNHYKIIKICQASKQISIKSTLEHCSNTSWSSLSPDFKSDIRNICQN